MSLLGKRTYLSRLRQTHWAAWLLLLLVLFVSGCSNFDRRIWLDAPGWRRGVLVGQTVVLDPVTLALGDDSLYMLLVEESDGIARPKVLALNRSAEPIWERTLDVRLQRPDQPQVVWDGSLLRLFWIDSERLYTARMNSGGELVGEVQPISSERVNAYDMAMDGGRIAIWFAGPRRDPGLYMLPAGDLQQEPVLVDEQGIRPQVRYDRQGNLHAIWARHPSGVTESNLLYARYPADGSQLTSTIAIADLTVGFTSSLEGPVFGVEDGTGYVFWTILVRTGLNAGAATTSYVTFPLDGPQEASTPQDLYVPADYDLSYAEAAPRPALQAGPRVPLDAGSRATPLGLMPNSRQAEELVVAARASVAYELRKVASQSTLIFLDEGQAQAYQLLSFTRSATSSPYVRSDDAGHLYATWLEPADPLGFHVYLGSTAPDTLASLKELTLADVQQMVIEAIFGMLSGAVLAPFAAILWLIAPLIIMGVTSFIRRESEGIISVGTGVSLALAVAAFIAVKTLTLPGFNEYVPFSAWVPIMPEWLDAPLQFGVPVLITALALATAWHFTFRRNTQSAIYFLLIYAAADSLLSMAVYGSIVYGAI